MWSWVSLTVDAGGGEAVLMLALHPHFERLFHSASFINHLLVNQDTHIQVWYDDPGTSHGVLSQGRIFAGQGNYERSSRVFVSFAVVTSVWRTHLFRDGKLDYMCHGELSF